MQLSHAYGSCSNSSLPDFAPRRRHRPKQHGAPGRRSRMRCLCIILCPAMLWAAPLDLSLKRAVELAISPEGSARVRLAEEALKQSQSRTAQAKAALLPDL